MEVGHILDDYQLGTVLGVGGYGIGYLAYRLKVGTRCVVKEFFPSTRQGNERVPLLKRNPDGQVVPLPGKERQVAQLRKAFRREIDVLRDHQDVGGVYDVQDTIRVNGNDYYVMPYYEGRTFQEQLRMRGAIPWREAWHTLQSLLTTLSVLHQKDLYHCDIKPANIYIPTAEDNKPRFLDLGAACYRDRRVATAYTPGYAPPELEENDNQKIGPWTDVYGLAATLFAAVVGERPPVSSERVGNEELEQLQAAEETCPPEVARVLVRALSLDHTRRYVSVSAFGVALEAATATLGQAEPPGRSSFSVPPRMPQREDRLSVQASSSLSSPDKKSTVKKWLKRTLWSLLIGLSVYVVLGPFFKEKLDGLVISEKEKTHVCESGSGRYMLQDAAETMYNRTVPPGKGKYAEASHHTSLVDVCSKLDQVLRDSYDRVYQHNLDWDEQRGQWKLEMIIINP